MHLVNTPVNSYFKMVLNCFLLQLRDNLCGPFLEITGFNVVAGLLHQVQVKCRLWMVESVQPRGSLLLNRWRR